MKKLICLILIIIMCLSVLTITAGAVPSPRYYGDVHRNGQTDILDATYIQMYLVNNLEFDKLTKAIADVDADGSVTILDATFVQKKLAKLIDEYPTSSNYIDHYISIVNVKSDFSSSKAMAGVPVTFDVWATCTDSILEYEFEISKDGVIVYTQSRAESKELKYTFDTPGIYELTVRVYNTFDECEEYKTEYEVIEFTDINTPKIVGVSLNQLDVCSYEDAVISAYVYYTDGPCKYKFTLDDMALVQDYSDSNEFSMGRLSVGEHKVLVEIRDSENNYDSYEYDFIITEPVA